MPTDSRPPVRTGPGAGETEAPKGLICDWCEKNAKPDADGFHMCQIAFGAAQERYCFCSDDCFEAFRKMYPSRVHRNCYERSCDGCEWCHKRYENEHEGIRALTTGRPGSETSHG
jgi:hypothetical protein